MSLSGDMSCVGVDRSRPITVFCCSVRPMFSVMCGLSSLSVGHSESRRMTDEIGISPERPIHFECN